MSLLSVSVYSFTSNCIQAFWNNFDLSIVWITPRIGAGTNFYCCPYRTLLPCLPRVCVCSCSYITALLVYRPSMSILAPLCWSPCVCPCHTLEPPCLMMLDKESNSVRQEPSIYWKKNSTSYTHVFFRTKQT